MIKIRHFYAMLCLLIGAVVSAQTSFYVSASKGSDANDGKTWQTAFSTLGKAIDLATVSGTTYNVFVAQGTYSPNRTAGPSFIVPAGVKLRIYGGYPAPESNNSTVADPCAPGSTVAYPTIFTGPRNSTYGYFEMSGASTAANRGLVLVNNITFQNINTNAVAGTSSSGLIHFANTSVNNDFTMENCIVDTWKSTAATVDAGMISADGGSQNTNITITNTTVRNGTYISEGLGGGFLYARGTAKNVTAKISGSNFYSNTAGGDSGANALIRFETSYTSDQGQSSLEITNSRFCNNLHVWAAGNTAGAVEVQNLKSLILTGNYFTQNAGGDGGAVHVTSVGNFQSSNNYYYQNGANGDGGAVLVTGADPSGGTFPRTVTFTNDFFYNNSTANTGTGFAGGALALKSAGYTTTITNSRFLSNGKLASLPVAGGGTVTNINVYNGGAVFINAGTLNVFGSTFCSNNSTNSGGAIFNQGATVNLGNSATAGNNYFTQNIAGANGGALLLVGGTTAISSYGNYYYRNNAGTGGAVSIDNGGTTNSLSFTSNNDNYNGNFATGNGGAIFAYNGGSGNLNLTIGGASYFYQNGYDGSVAQTANGGGIFLHGIGNETVSITGAQFIANRAKTNGGAINIEGVSAVQQASVNTISSSLFYNNIANGSSTAQGVDIFVNKGSLNYFGRIANFNNNKTQLVYETATNYPTAGYGYSSATGNSQQTTAVAYAAPTGYSCPAVPTAVCGANAIVIPPAALLTVTANDGTMPANEVDVCIGNVATVNFLSPTGTGPITFAYTIRKVDNSTGAYTDTAGTVSSPGNTVASVNSEAVQFGYTYHYIVNKVTDANGLFTDYSCGLNMVTINVVNCPVDPCDAVPNTEDGPAVKHGITSLQRAGADNGNWPMVRTSAYTALESKTKGFVPTRINDPETAVASPVKGMMVWDGDANNGNGCLKINIDGTPAGWKCFNIRPCLRGRTPNNK